MDILSSIEPPLLGAVLVEIYIRCTPGLCGGFIQEELECLVGFDFLEYFEFKTCS